MEEKLVLPLLKRACDISLKAYAPYSGFGVGCAVLLKDGRIIEGVNVENASYPVTLCAERAALAQVVTQGLIHLVSAIAIVTKAVPPVFPCGMCRQFMDELLPKNTPIIVGGHDGQWLKSDIAELLPYSFNRNSLEAEL
ncbi:MAG TPA: cytidine deaminase [Myxococcota bacterium]|nr:cytidine deaminase [Myxococcota bacterium]